MRWHRFLPHFAPDTGAADSETAERPNPDTSTKDAEAMTEESWMENIEDIDDDHGFMNDLREIYYPEETEEDEAAAELEEADEEEVDTVAEDEPDDEEETETEQAEDIATEEEEDETEVSDETEPAELPLLRELLPEAVIESEEDARTHLTRLKESDVVLQEFEKLAEGDDQLMKYIALRNQGVERRLAAPEAFGEWTQVPDPDTDPEAFGEWKERQGELRAQKRLEEQQGQQETQARQDRAQAQQRIFQATMKRRGWDEDRASLIASEYQKMLAGDQVTQKGYGKTFEIIDDGLRHGAFVSELESVLDKAETAGPSSLKESENDSEIIKRLKSVVRSTFTKGAKKVKETEKEIRHAANLESQGSRTRELTPEEEERRGYESRFERAGSLDMSWPPGQ